MFPSDFVVKETLLSRPFLLLVSLVSAGCIGSKRIFQTIQKWFLLREFTRTLELQLFKHIDDIRLFGQRSLNGSSKSYMDREKFESLNLIFSVHRETCIVIWVEKKKKKKEKQVTKILEITSVRQTTRETLETIPRYVDETDRHQQGKDK